MTLFEVLQDVASNVPELLRPLIVALAGAIPFVEGELASVLGVWAGINPIVAGLAGAAGNFAAVLGVVVLGARIRAALAARRARRLAAGEITEKPAKPESKGRARFTRFVVRFGVPGASILGPLALPTHFTSAILVGSGVSKSWVLLWQGIAIVLWTTFTTLVATGVLAAVAG